MAIDQELLTELKKRLADRFTASELIELMEISVEELIEAYFDFIPAYVIEEMS